MSKPLKITSQNRRSRKRRESRDRPPLETAALILLSQKEPSARELARLLGVSLATVHRIIAALRRKRARILPVRENGRWHYEVRMERSEEEVLNDRLLKTAGFIRKWKAAPDKTEDEIIYGVREGAGR